MVEFANWICYNYSVKVRPVPGMRGRAPCAAALLEPNTYEEAFINMSGHSKWNNIKRKKEKTDAQKAKIFTKVGREIAVAVKSGGADPAVNGKLRDLIAKAKSLNVPNDNIQRIIKKAEGAEKDDYESITYEATAPPASP